MATWTKFQQFLEDKNHGVHNFNSDSLKVALCAAANAPVNTNSVLTDLTQISYANLVSQAVSVNSSGQSAGTYTLSLVDKQLAASGGAVGPFRYIVLYNDTPTSPADPLIMFSDYGSDLTLNDGETLDLDFGSDGGPNGVAFTET